VFFFSILKKEKRSTHQDQVSVFDITEERINEALILTSVYLTITEERRREAFTKTSFFFFFLFRRQKKRSADQDQVSIKLITKERSREAYIKTIFFLLFRS
jgi:hypothetical protein